MPRLVGILIPLFVASRFSRNIAGTGTGTGIGTGLAIALTLKN